MLGHSSTSVTKTPIKAGIRPLIPVYLATKRPAGSAFLRTLVRRLSAEGVRTPSGTT
ncbi:hypothetical protein JG688_00008911 [Phytophthora aleatoria]|uniref:Uncharacterized protein n=1 Tax=Phytophthora aleatoria TaxID=2496075 RepID=A0A8J5IUE1_9STRA|nr:hypothetical protein JG688_00008911 [Phytophthora aleatoria]